MSGNAVTLYLGLTTDHRGRTLAQLQNLGLAELESAHDVVQWLFPTDTPSRFNPLAPPLDEEQIRAFKARPELKERLLASLDLMLAFFGLVRRGREVLLSPTYPERKRFWVAAGNHNTLRLTRILRSLRLLGLEDEARALLRALEGLGRLDRWKLGNDAFRHWRRACE